MGKNLTLQKLLLSVQAQINTICHRPSGEAKEEALHVQGTTLQSDPIFLCIFEVFQGLARYNITYIVLGPRDPSRG